MAKTNKAEKVEVKQARFRDNTSQGFIAELYRKHEGDKEKIMKDFLAAHKAGKIQSNNPEYRVNRCIFEFHKKEKNGYII